MNPTFLVLMSCLLIFRGNNFERNGAKILTSPSRGWASFEKFSALQHSSGHVHELSIKTTWARYCQQIGSLMVNILGLMAVGGKSGGNGWLLPLLNLSGILSEGKMFFFFLVNKNSKPLQLFFLILCGPKNKPAEKKKVHKNQCTLCGVLLLFSSKKSRWNRFNLYLYNQRKSVI